jgi:hypothetical protein
MEELQQDYRPIRAFFFLLSSASSTIAPPGILPLLGRNDCWSFVGVTPSGVGLYGP